MKPEDLVNDRERELMKPYYENRGPYRQCLVDAVAVYDKDQAKQGMDSTVYMFLDPLLTDEMCEVLSKMKLRKMMYPKEISRRCGKPVGDVVRLCLEMADIGAIEVHTDDKGADMFYVPQLCVGALEWCMIGPMFKDHPEQALLFEHETFESFTGKGKYLPISNHGVHRTVPIESALTPDVKRMSWEELTPLIESNADGFYAVGTCICRQGRLVNGTSSGEPSLEWCTCLGDFARYCVRTGRARQISKEEFYGILKAAEERGFVHNVANANGKDKIEYICNCDYKTCYTLRADMYSVNSSMTRSNFVAQVDPEKCVACGMCVETCPENAVRMGQRLDPKKPLQYHYRETPHEYLKWGEERWHPDYLYERENVWEETGTAPCKTACPAHVAVEGYLRLAALGKYDEALELIKHNNPLPAVCGSICNRRCEAACTRGRIDQPVAIDEVKKFLAHRDLEAETRYIPKKKITRMDGKKVAVIGGGPAGLACAYYLEVEGEHVTVFEKHDKIGGMLRYGVPNFRLEKDVLDAEIDVIRQLGAEFKCGIEVGKDVTIQQLREQGYEAFYIAIGCQGGRSVNVPGEDADGVIAAVDFLQKYGTDSKLDGDAVIIGGGNVAVDTARTAVRLGAGKTYMYCLESREEMPAAQDELDEAEADGVIVGCGWGPKEILSENGNVTGIVFKKCLSVRDENGKFSPVFDENDTVTVPCSHVVLAVGQSVVWGELLKGENVVLRGGNYPEADKQTFQTSVPDIFVGGDVFTGPQWSIDAIACGKEGADSIHRFVWGGNLKTGRDRNLYHEIDKDNVLFGSYDNAHRQSCKRTASKARTFSDDREVFTEEQVKAETARCLKCGASHVDENMCLGCGVCTTRCKFDAIHLRRVFECTPCTREQLVPAVLGEVGRRMVWSKFHEPSVKTVEVGVSNIDPDVSYASGAKYHKPPKKK